MTSDENNYIQYVAGPSAGEKMGGPTATTTTTSATSSGYCCGRRRRRELCGRRRLCGEMTTDEDDGCFRRSIDRIDLPGPAHRRRQKKRHGDQTTVDAFEIDDGKRTKCTSSSSSSSCRSSPNKPSSMHARAVLTRRRREKPTIHHIIPAASVCTGHSTFRRCCICILYRFG